MRRVVHWAAIAAVIAASLALGLRAAGEPPSPAARAARIAAGLRCPVCQGLSVEDSDSATARAIRDDITRRLAAGESDRRVRQAYVDRYGEWILLRPKASGFEALAWVLPAAFVGAAAVVLGWAFWRWRRRGRSRAPTVDERLLVARALRQRPRPADGAAP